ncbi:hypothetical protein CHCC14600_3443 [Bacillus licheniformis]|nr:hypothetical protein CHCC14600_3443 [Bacillus licheniformis]
MKNVHIKLFVSGNITSILNLDIFQVSTSARILPSKNKAAY